MRALHTMRLSQNRCKKVEWSIRLKIVVEGVGATSYDARHPITGIDKETSPNPKGTLLSLNKKCFGQYFGIIVQPLAAPRIINARGMCLQICIF